MIKSFYISVIILLCFFFTCSNGFCSEGKQLFINKCAQCHNKNKNQKVKALGPAKYASIQWVRFFKRNKHKRYKNISSFFTKKEQALIMDYLIDHAADSDLPIAAGIR
jgi:hypothetical protein